MEFSKKILIIFLLASYSLSAECNKGVTKCRDCLPGGNKCSECLQETYVLTKNGNCIECKEVKGCKKDLCDRYGCKACENGFFRSKNEKMGIFYCKEEHKKRLRVVLWVSMSVFLVLIVLGVVYFLNRKKEEEEDLYDKLLSRDKSIRSGSSDGRSFESN